MWSFTHKRQLGYHHNSAELELDWGEEGMFELPKKQTPLIHLTVTFQKLPAVKRSPSNRPAPRSTNYGDGEQTSSVRAE